MLRWLMLTMAALVVPSGAVTLAPTYRVKGQPGVELTLKCGDGNNSGVVKFWNSPFGAVHVAVSVHAAHLEPVLLQRDGGLLLPNISSVHSGLYYCLQEEGGARTLRPTVLNIGTRTKSRTSSVPDVPRGHYTAAVASSVLLSFVLGFSSGAVSRTHVLRCLSAVAKKMRLPRQRCSYNDELDRGVAMVTVSPSETSPIPPTKPQRSFRRRSTDHAVEERRTAAYLESCDHVKNEERKDGRKEEEEESRTEEEEVEEDRKQEESRSEEVEEEVEDRKQEESRTEEVEEEVEDRKQEESRTEEVEEEVEDRKQEESRSEEVKEEVEDRKQEESRSEEVKEEVEDRKQEESRTEEVKEEVEDRKQEESRTEEVEEEVEDSKQEESRSEEVKEEVEDRKQEESRTEEVEEEVEDRKQEESRSEEVEEEVEDRKQEESRSEEVEVEEEDRKQEESQSEEVEEEDRKQEESWTEEGNGKGEEEGKFTGFCLRGEEEEEVDTDTSSETETSAEEPSGSEATPTGRRVIRLYQYDEDGRRYAHLPDPAPYNPDPAPRLKQRSLSLTRLNAIMAAASSSPLDRKQEVEPRPHFHMEI